MGNFMFSINHAVQSIMGINADQFEELKELGHFIDYYNSIVRENVKSRKMKNKILVTEKHEIIKQLKSESIRLNADLKKFGKETDEYKTEIDEFSQLLEGLEPLIRPPPAEEDEEEEEQEEEEDVGEEGGGDIESDEEDDGQVQVPVRKYPFSQSPIASQDNPLANPMKWDPGQRGEQWPDPNDDYQYLVGPTVSPTFSPYFSRKTTS